MTKKYSIILHWSIGDNALVVEVLELASCIVDEQIC